MAPRKKKTIKNTSLAFGQTGNPFVTTQLSQTTTLFKNNRWYLVSNNRQLLAEVYVEHGVIQTVIDVPVNDGLRGGIEIKSKQLGTDEIDELQTYLERENIISFSVAQAMKWTRLFGGGAVIIVTDQDPKTPLDLSKISEDSPLGFKPCDMWEINFDLQNVESTEPVPTVDSEYYNYYGIQLHKSRVLIMKGLQAPSFIRPRLRGWGYSVIESVVRSINQYLKANDLSFEVLDEFKIDIFKFQDLKGTLMSAQGTELARRRVQIANASKNYNNALVMDKNDDYQQKSLSFTGMSEIMKEIRMQIACDLRMPLTKIFGVSATGFNSGQDDIENYNAMVESDVRQKAKFDILRIVEICCQKLFGYIPDDLSIGFKPLRVLSAVDEETVKNSQFDRMLRCKQSGEMTTREFKEGLNKNNLLPVQLDPNIETLDVQTDENDGGDTKSAPQSKAHLAKEAST